MVDEAVDHGGGDDVVALHAPAARLAKVPPRKLADWIFDFHFGDCDYFEIDVVPYAEALGSDGLERLRERVETLRAAAGPARPGSWGSHDQHVVEWFDQRFAVLDRDADAIIRTHLRGGHVAASHEAVAAALEEIDEIDLALDWAQQAVMFGLGHQSQAATKRWWALLESHRPNGLSEAAHVIFERWPSSGTGARLIETAGREELPTVLRTLEQHPSELVHFQLSTLDDVDGAWSSAHRLGMRSDGLWHEVAVAYLDTDPVAAIRVLLDLVAESLVVTNQRAYRPAARELKKLRAAARAAHGAAALAMVDETIADLRERYRRRTTMITAFDKAQLP